MDDDLRAEKQQTKGTASIFMAEGLSLIGESSAINMGTNEVEHFIVLQECS